jgi:hypothetical protein
MKAKRKPRTKKIKPIHETIHEKARRLGWKPVSPEIREQSIRELSIALLR